MRAAVQAAVNSLTAGRTTKERVVVWQGGTISAGSRISLPSYPTNVRVGLAIDHVDIANTGNNAILIENRYNTLVYSTQNVCA